MKVAKIPIDLSCVVLTFKTASSSSKPKWDLYYEPLYKTLPLHFLNLNLCLSISNRIPFPLFSQCKQSRLLLAAPQSWLKYRTSENKNKQQNLLDVCLTTLSATEIFPLYFCSTSTAWLDIRVIWGTFKVTDVLTPSIRNFVISWSVVWLRNYIFKKKKLPMWF